MVVVDPDPEIVLRFDFRLHKALLGHLIINFALLNIEQLLLVVSIVLVNPVSDFLSFFKRFMDFLLCSILFFLEHAHTILELHNVFLYFEPNRTSLGVGKVL